MLADPECGGDLLALGVALLDYAVLRTDTDRTFQHYAAMAWGEEKKSWRGSHVRHVLRKDIRRYDAVKDANESAAIGDDEPEARDEYAAAYALLTNVGRWCGAPMVRRQGPCGKPAGLQTLLTDADTGRKQWLAACSRHRPWFEARVHANRLAVEETAVVVRPPANAGGVLARHIPEIDWEAVWVDIDPSWTPPPEVEPEVVPLKPRLTLVLGGAS